MSETDTKSYDVEADPKLLVERADAGQDAAAKQEPIANLGDESEFAAWVIELAREFQHAVEETDLWKALWNDSLHKYRPEKIVQATGGDALRRALSNG